MSFFDRILGILGRCRMYGSTFEAENRVKDDKSKGEIEIHHKSTYYDDLHDLENCKPATATGSMSLESKRRLERIQAKQRKLRSPQSIPVIPVCSNLSDFIKNRVRMNAMDNLNPKLHKKSDDRKVTSSDFDETVTDEIDAREVFDIIRDINDPEHPLTLEELNVVGEDKIEVDNVNNYVKVSFTPTIPHCSMATLIGLAIRVQLMRSLPSRFKIDVEITPGSHASECAINKQLADKERVAAALENSHLIEVVNQCLTIKGY